MKYYGDCSWLSIVPGSGTELDQASLIQVGVDTNWPDVKVSGYCTQSLKTNGDRWSWGSNYFGELGNGTSAALTDKITPILQP